MTRTLIVNLKRRFGSGDGRDMVVQTSTAIVERDPQSPRVKPLKVGCPIWLEDKYRNFAPRYRDGFSTITASVTAIRWSKEVKCYVALYTASFFNHSESFIWGWIDGRMVELEQVNVRESGGREIDQRWLATVSV